MNETTLFDVADQFIKDFDGKFLCIDEIHRYNNWRQELKSIYDSFPQLQVLFSGSSSIDLVKGTYDLSRRAQLKKIFGFSFREYINFTENTDFQRLELVDLFAEPSEYLFEIAKTPKLLGSFKQYLVSGYYPSCVDFESQEAFLKSLVATLDKSIYVDLSDIYSVSSENLNVIKKLLYFFATSSPGELSINKLASSLRRDHKTIASYIEMLREAGFASIPSKRGLWTCHA